MPRALQGVAPALAIGSMDDFTVADMSARTSFEELYAAARKDQALRGTAGDAFDALKMLDVFGEIVTTHLGADAATAARVFPGHAIDRAKFKGMLRG